MSAKDIILARIRAALADGAEAPEIPRGYRRGPAEADLDLLVDRLTDYRAVVHRTSADAIAEVIAEIVSGTVVVPPGLPREWLPEGIQGIADNGLSPDRIAAADAVVTAASVAIAETGTIVLDGSPDQGRRIIFLLPDRHVCVLRPDQVVASVPEALAQLDPTRPLTWISGPSATSDIELNRVEGVHGPRNLHVIIIGR